MDNVCELRWYSVRGCCVEPRLLQRNDGVRIATVAACTPPCRFLTRAKLPAPSYVPYCSSDVFSGDKAAGDGSKWHFRGKSILNALVQDLGGLGIGQASDVAVAGCSAGAQTVVVNLDYVAKLLGSVTKAPVSGIMDAGWFLNRTPLVSYDTAPSIQFVRYPQLLWLATVSRADPRVSLSSARGAGSMERSSRRVVR